MNAHTQIQSRTGGWDMLPAQTADPLLALIGQFRADRRSEKIDLGVGVYKDDRGETPVFAAVKAAELILQQKQDTKAYLGAEGDLDFVDKLFPLVFGGAIDPGLFVGLQTPGGTGALRLGAELLRRAQSEESRIFLGMPAWANHVPTLKDAGLTIKEYAYLDVNSRGVDFDALMTILSEANRGDALLLQGNGHNPTSHDLSEAQWLELAGLLTARGIIPFLDMAYHGLGDGLDADAQGARIISDLCPDVIVAYSCDKNFGLYRDRVGALFVKSQRPEQLPGVMLSLMAIARTSWSMPPDHGAAVVRLILEDPELTTLWKAELETMKDRIQSLRANLSMRHPLLACIASQKGMFSFLPLSKPQIVALREDFGIYMAGSGRISLTGLNARNVDWFVKAIESVATV
jgi:aromatic-amino-acid transaminase